jgi:phospholipase C
MKGKFMDAVMFRRGLSNQQGGRGRPRRFSARLALEALEARNLLASAVTLSTATVADGPATVKDLQEHIKHVIVIYQENWSFDSLYGLFPGANGIQNANDTIPQYDKVTGEQITTLPQPLINGMPDPRFPDDLPVEPYDTAQYVPPDETTGDIVHRYYQEISQINGGTMNGFVTWSDNGGLTFSYYDATNMPEGQLAKQYVLADNFFHSAFGGSFLNHQFLVAAAAPRFTRAPDSLRPILDDNGHLALDSDGNIIHDGSVTPDGYGVNTLYSRNLVPPFVTDYTTLIPSQNDSDPFRPDFTPTIGDRLSDQHVSWKWYSGGWDDALNGNADPLFQWHHQPFAYFDNYAPGTQGQKSHLQDEKDFFNDLYGDNLPSVSFIKPLGPDNEHPGYTSLLQGQQHVADIVSAVQNSSAWDSTAIVVTYDENGGRWDHVAPPVRDEWGPGTRVPALIISPFAKTSYVDHTQYETLSLLKTIEEIWNLQPLNQRDDGAKDLRNAFQFPGRRNPARTPGAPLIVADFTPMVHANNAAPGNASLASSAEPAELEENPQAELTIDEGTMDDAGTATTKVESNQQFVQHVTSGMPQLASVLGVGQDSMGDADIREALGV